MVKTDFTIAEKERRKKISNIENENGNALAACAECNNTKIVRKKNHSPVIVIDAMRAHTANANSNSPHRNDAI